MKAPCVTVAQVAVAAGLLGLLSSGAANAPPPAAVPSCGRAVLRTLAVKGEARVLVTLRPSALGGTPGDGRVRPPGRVLDELLKESFPSDLREEGRLRSVPVLFARINSRGLSRLLEDPRVSRVDLDGEVRGADAGSNALIGADTVQALGFSGEGVTIAVLDTGTDSRWPDLASSLAGEECFCSSGGACCPDGTRRQSGPGAAASAASHGPAVFGILTADGIGAPTGVAPAARVLAIRVLDDSAVGTFSDILLALDWILQNRPEIRLVNMSLAAGFFPAGCDHLFAFNEAMAQIADLFRARGGLLFAATGNNGIAGFVGTPACVTSVVGVGAVTSNDQFLGFTNANAALDLLAPGLGIQTTGPFPQIVFFSGTSAATPHAVGTAALVLAANPSLTADELEAQLKEGGVPVVDPRTGSSYPRVDALRSVAVPVEISLEPRAFPFRSRGRGLSVRIEPHPPFSAADLDPETLTLALEGGTRIPVNPDRADFADSDGDGIEDLTVGFDRRLLLAGSGSPGPFPVILRGSFVSGLGVWGKSSLEILPVRGTGRPADPTP